MNRYERERSISESEEMSILKEILKQRDRFKHDTGSYPKHIKISRKQFFKIMAAASNEGLLEVTQEIKHKLAGMDVVFDDNPFSTVETVEVGGRTDE